MPKVSNFKRLRKSSPKFPKDTPVKRSGGETSLDPAKKLSTQQTLSKFFSLNSGKNEYTAKKRSSEISEDLSSLDVRIHLDFPGYSPPKLLKSDYSHGTGKRKREQVSPHTVQKLQGFSQNSTECASVARHDVINSTPLIHRGKETLLISAKPYADRDLEGENFSGSEEDCETPSSSANYKSKEIMCSKRFKNNGTSKSVLETADAKNKLTPLEKQVVELKKQHPDVLLLIECGYKYRFFGEDAEVASKELNIICYLDHNFYTACIPTHRLFVHVQRLVAQGYKVGVVKQTETAALKAAGENKNTLFQRKLQALYTKATLIGEEFNALCPTNSEHGETSPVISGYLACVYEVPALSKQKFDVSVAVVAVQPSSGDTFYSTFKDTPTRTDLESCLTRLNPVELLLPISSLSERTESLIQNMCFQSSACGSKIRVERMADISFEYTSALNKVMEFYGSNDGICGSNSDDVQKITDLCPEVLCCLAALIAYLKDFNLDSILKNMNTLKSSMSSANCMSLNAITMRNLEIFQNLGNYSEQGSLLWAVNHTSTKFGKKMLHSWIASPLKDIVQIEERLDVITEMLHSDSSSVFPVIEKTLARLPDLERGLCSALYQRCSCWEFYVLVQSLTSVRREFQAISERASSEIQTVKLKDIVSEIIYLLEGIDSFSENLHENSARKNDKTTLFLDTSKYPAVVDTQQRIKDVEKNLKDLRIGIAKVLRLPAFDYCTVSGQKYLIEVHNKSVSVVPSDWVKISGTKQVSRFRSPEVEMLHNQLRQLNEQLLVNCDESWKMFLIEFGSSFYNYKKAVTLLAELDCYFSMAKFSKQQGYCRPVIVNSEKQILNITQGRNPVLEKLLGEHCQYVANDTKLNSEKCCMVITGPNMGGKSSYVRQVAIITILAQMGCYVPAESATLSMFDGIYMRMGASDDLYLKRSTFMTEMQETSDILLHATSKSLVVLDELGRGTSTHDGMAIAYSTLNFLLEKVNCITLFVTHYPPVAELKKLYPKKVSNNHMTFIVSQNDNKKSGIGTLTFLYSVSEGIAEKSYGINVADLAEIPVEVLNEAKKKSQELERCIQQRRFLKDIVGCVFSFTKTAAEKLGYLQKLCLD